MFQILQPSGATNESSEFGHRVAPLKLVSSPLRLSESKLLSDLPTQPIYIPNQCYARDATASKNMKANFETKSVEGLMEDLPNGEARGSPKVDNLTVSTNHPNVGGAAVGQNLFVSHIGED